MAQIDRKGIHSLGQILLELVLVMPPTLLIAVYLSPTWSNVWLWFGIITASALIGFIFQSFIHVKKEGLWLTLFLLCAVGLYFVTGLHQGIHVIILFIIGYVAFARGFKVASGQEHASAYSTIYACGLAVHALVFLVSMIRSEWRQLQPLLAVLGIIALFSVTFLLNRKQLGKANYSDMNHVAVPQYVLRLNMRYVVIFLGSIFILATLLFSSMMDGLWQAFRRMMNSLLSNQTEPPPEQVMETPASPFELPAAGEEQSANLFWVWLERIVSITVAVILICCVTFLILWLFRNLIQRWFPRLWEALRRFLTQERVETPDMDYEDQHFSLLQWDKLKNELKLPFNNLLRRMKHKPDRLSDYQTNRDRIRFLYRSKVREAEEAGYKPQPSLTPKETLSELADRGADSEEKKQIDQLTSLYNTARYSEEEIRDEHLQTLLQANRNKK